MKSYKIDNTICTLKPHGDLTLEEYLATDRYVNIEDEDFGLSEEELNEI